MRVELIKDYAFPVHFLTREFFYSKGNIVRFYPGYSNVRGFWLCKPEIGLVACTSEGAELPPGTYFGEQSPRSVPPTPQGWLWFDTNAGRHPAFDRYNEHYRAKYLRDTDESYVISQEGSRKFREEIAKRTVERQQFIGSLGSSLGGFAQRVSQFDWTWQEADQFYPGMSEKRDEIFQVLESIPFDTAWAIWSKCGPGDYRGAGHPNWTKCTGFQYPAEYILGEISGFTHFPSGRKLEIERGTGRWPEQYLVFFSEFDEQLPIYAKGEIWARVIDRLQEARKARGLSNSNLPTTNSK